MVSSWPPWPRPGSVHPYAKLAHRDSNGKSINPYHKGVVSNALRAVKLVHGQLAQQMLRHLIRPLPAPGGAWVAGVN